MKSFKLGLMVLALASTGSMLRADDAKGNAMAFVLKMDRPAQ